MGPLYAYNNGYNNPIQALLMTPVSDNGQGAKPEYLEPQEVFDILLRKECEKNSRRISPPQHTPVGNASFNQYSFNRAGSTLALMKSLEHPGRPAAAMKPVQDQEEGSLQIPTSPASATGTLPPSALSAPAPSSFSPRSSDDSSMLRSLQDQVVLQDSLEEENDPAPVNEKV